MLCDVKNGVYWEEFKKIGGRMCTWLERTRNFAKSQNLTSRCVCGVGGYQKLESGMSRITKKFDIYNGMLGNSRLWVIRGKKHL